MYNVYYCTSYITALIHAHKAYFYRVIHTRTKTTTMCTLMDKNSTSHSHSNIYYIGDYYDYGFTIIISFSEVEILISMSLKQNLKICNKIENPNSYCSN